MQQLKNKLQGKDLYRDGLIINTTLNSRIQKYANEAVDGVSQEPKRRSFVDVICDDQTA